MGANTFSGKAESSTAVKATLSYLFPYLEQFWRRPLRDYAEFTYDVPRFCSSNRDRRHALILLKNCVARAARRSGFNEVQAKAAAQQLMDAPLIQTGPHCLLILEPDAFYTHLFSLSGLKAQSRNWHICYHASTVSFREKGKRGPGWLVVEGEALNVFGLPRRMIDSRSVCGLNGPYRFALSNADGSVAPNETAVRLLKMLPTDEFRCASDAIREANQVLWQRWVPSSANLLQIDDFDVADLVADHLDDTRSWVTNCLVGDGRFSVEVLAEIDRLADGPWAGWIKRSTDFFWGLRNGKIVPLRLIDGVLRENQTAHFEVQFRPASIAVSLRRREIVPNLLTMFLVTSILPGVRVLGGCRHVVYYPLMRHLIASSLAHLGQRDLLDAMASDVRPGMWGHRVLTPEDGYPLSELEFGGSGEGVLQIYAGEPLGLASGDLTRFRDDPIWADISAQISAATITNASKEWRWT